MGNPRGVVAAGHTLTADAAAEVLRAGGNAFDAVLAALSVACVVEPVLCTPGGGGFLLARPAEEKPRVYDFFVQTPAIRRGSSDLDFRPILADFGGVTQEFHIGHGTAAVPGLVRGLFEIHRDLGTLPMGDIMAQAVTHAKDGITMTPFQAYVLKVVAATFTATEACHSIFRSAHDPSQLDTERIDHAFETQQRQDVGAHLWRLVHQTQVIDQHPDVEHRGEVRVVGVDRPVATAQVEQQQSDEQRQTPRC